MTKEKNEMGTQKRQHGTPVYAKRGALHKQGASLRENTIYRMGEWTAAQIVRLKGRGPCVVRPSFEGMMAGGRECYNPLGDSRSKTAWRNRHLTVLGMTQHGYRVFSLIEMEIYCHTLTLLMDAKTGTFYDATSGLCKSSEIERVDHIVIVDDVKPYLRANAERAPKNLQWGNDDPFYHRPVQEKAAAERKASWSIKPKKGGKNG